MLNEEGIRNENVPYSECDSELHTELGQLVSLKRLLKNQLEDNNVHHVDAENEVDLILSRGAGLFFDYKNPGVLDQLKNKFFCKKHVLQFGSNWDKTSKFVADTRKGNSRLLACGLHPSTTTKKKVAAHKKKFLTKAQSEAMLHIGKLFYPIGTPLCPNHFMEAQKYVTEFVAVSLFYYFVNFDFKQEIAPF
jgi:hypothetical protein